MGTLTLDQLLLGLVLLNLFSHSAKEYLKLKKKQTVLIINLDIKDGHTAHLKRQN